MIPDAPSPLTGRSVLKGLLTGSVVVAGMLVAGLQIAVALEGLF